jgi:hypothetical protein
MEPQFCAEVSCVKHTEHRGGRFFYSVSDGKTYCEDCYGLHVIPEPGKNLWDYHTTHFDGKNRYIGSLQNMRKLEKQFGVSNQAANDYTRNWK